MAQVFSFKFCEISKNTFFIEHLWWLLLKFEFRVEKVIHSDLLGTCQVTKIHFIITVTFDDELNSSTNILCVVMMMQSSHKSFVQIFYSFYIFQLPFEYRSCRTEVKKGVLRNFEKFTGKHLCQIFFLINIFFTEHLRVFFLYRSIINDLQTYKHMPYTRH